MRKTLISAALAAALFAGPGTAAATDGFAASRPDTGASFAALSGVPAEAMSAEEMAAVEGRVFVTRVSLPAVQMNGFTSLSTSTSFFGRFSFSTGLSVPHPVCSLSTCGNGGKLTGWHF